MSNIKCNSCNTTLGINQVARVVAWPGNFVKCECNICNDVIYHCYECYYMDHKKFNRVEICKNCERDKKIETLYEL